MASNTNTQRGHERTKRGVGLNSPTRPEALQSPLASLGQRAAITGLALYVIFAPHSVAASSIAIGVAGLGWLLRTVVSGSTGLRRSKFDLIIVLCLLWTTASSILSAEPAISIKKLTSLWSVFIFYLVRAVLTRRTALVMVFLLILSGATGVLASIFDLARGRGVVVQSFNSNSPFLTNVQPGDTIWRVGHTRIYSLTNLDDSLRSIPSDKPFSISIISQGEHVEREGVTISAEQQKERSPSGVIGAERNHLFRASGWTRHYETFAELLQMIAQLALGLALAHFTNHGFNKYFRVALMATVLLTLGIALTAMRTVVVAFVIGASVIAWRALRGTAKVVFTFALFFVLAFGAVVVWQTRAHNALSLTDPSSSLRYQVARVGLSRIPLHPLFGHGMDAMKKHWNEWGFPGKDMLHLHSTPLQLAFDRGLPMLVLWLWLMMSLWIEIAKTERRASDLSDTNAWGVLLGILGALTGFLMSSIVNYNYGDSEVVMLFWFLMGVAIKLNSQLIIQQNATGSEAGGVH
ncbi:MAG: hypothetical protein C5B55_02880 [Blastocatellia bacterium]|nr:MAG: hypothetical protein C5B55_02880 [Blastocatellia bacterium]